MIFIKFQESHCLFFSNLTVFFKFFILLDSQISLIPMVKMGTNILGIISYCPALTLQFCGTGTRISRRGIEWRNMRSHWQQRAANRMRLKLRWSRTSQNIAGTICKPRNGTLVDHQRSKKRGRTKAIETILDEVSMIMTRRRFYQYHLEDVSPWAHAFLNLFF